MHDRNGKSYQFNFNHSDHILKILDLVQRVHFNVNQRAQAGPDCPCKEKTLDQFTSLITV